MPNVKPYDCNGHWPTNLVPKPYTKSTLTNKSQAKRKKKWINTYLNRNKDVVDGSPLHKQSVMAIEKSFFPCSLVENRLKPPWTASSTMPNANEPTKQSCDLFIFKIRIFFLAGWHILLTHDIYPISRDSLKMLRYIKKLEYIVIFSRRYIAEPFVARYIAISLIYVTMV